MIFSLTVVQYYYNDYYIIESVSTTSMTMVETISTSNSATDDSSTSAITTTEPISTTDTDLEECEFIDTISNVDMSLFHAYYYRFRCTRDCNQCI